MNPYQSISRLKHLILVAIVVTGLVITSAPVYATDCNTDCDKACTTDLGVDPFCRARCVAEKEIACGTGFTTCEIWRAEPGYLIAVEEIELANRAGWVENENACHAIVNGESGTVEESYLSFAYLVAKEVVKASIDSTIIGWAVSEAIDHQLHCACNEANFVTSDPGPVPLACVEKTGSHVCATTSAQKTFRTIRQGITGIVPGGKILVVAGTYAETPRITKTMTIKALDGKVTIGASTTRATTTDVLTGVTEPSQKTLLYMPTISNPSLTR